MGSGLINLGTQAMFASNAMLNTTANNISNAHTEGYSRQTVELATEPGRYTGSGFMGRGVAVATVSRSANAFLTREVNQNTAVATSDQARLDKLKQMEQVFPLGESGLGYAATQFLNSYVDVANTPQDVSARQVSLARAGDLAGRMSAAASQLDDLQQGVVSDLRNSAASANNLTARIADVNKKIASLKGSGHEPNDLLDQRDQLVKQLNDIVAVTTVTAEDGTMGVFAGGGQRLVLGETADTLVVSQDAFDPAKAQISLRDAGGLRTLDPKMIVGGSMAGLLRVQNEDIPDSRNRLGQMAASLSSQVNDQQGLGLWPGPPPDFGQPIFNAVQPQLLPSNANRSSLSTPPIGVTAVPGQSASLQASDYRIEVDPAGAITLTRLSDLSTTALNPGSNTVDGMDITIDGAALQPGDRFELRPVGRAAADMKRVLDDPRGLAAASPFTATVQAGNEGTVSVGSLAMTARPDASLLPGSGGLLSIAFTSGTGDYELRDPSGGVLGSGTWQSNQPIAYNGFSLTLNGKPSLGDVVQVQTTTYLSGNNGNALAMMGLRDRAMVGQQTLPNGGTVPGATISDAYSNFIGDLGVNVQGAQTSAQISATLASSSKEVLSNTTGVNLDEEAARLIQFQQSYQAAAKIVQVAQTIFATLLQTAGG